jgi:hypothetical protein
MLYLVKSIDQFNNSNIFFSQPIKNNIINDSNFIRIKYSSNVTFNGIYLYISFINKNKCFIDIHLNKELIEKIKNIEQDILKISGIKNKIPQYNIYNQLSNGFIKNNSYSYNYILKISGIWETNTNYGLTFKFISTLS